MVDCSLDESISQFSRLVNDALDCLGYSAEQIQLRSDIFPDFYRKLSDKCNNLFGQDIGLVLSGSRLDGVPLECSDTDLLLLYKDVICVEEGQGEEGLTVLETRMQDCLPGYTKLHVRSLCETDINGLLERATVNTFSSGVDQFLVSSTFFLNEICTLFSYAKPLQNHVTFEGMSSNGPAVTITLSMRNPITNTSVTEECDVVPALPIYLRDTLKEWTHRQRYHDWPPPEVVLGVLATEACLVAISLSECKDAHLEWRICFPQGEKRLLHSLNEVQLKVYVLLKMVKREIISKVSDGITSYMMKNVIMWVCEGMPSALFIPEFLVDRLKNALHFIKVCIVNNFLPCYLIPQRNLLLGKLEGHNKYLVLNILSELIDSNAAYLLQCNSLSEALVLSYKHPIVAINAKLARNKLELLLLTSHQRVLNSMDWESIIHEDAVWFWLDTLLQDPRFISYTTNLINILGFDFLLKALDPRCAGQITKLRQRALLS